MSRQQQKPSKNSDLLRYAGLGAQIFVSLGIAVFAGYKADDWLGMRFPLLVWLLPLVVLTALILGVIRTTSKRKNEHEPKSK
jgi:hypothetical protein